MNKTMNTKQNKYEPGIAVDAGGAPAIDPTANVIALSEAATKRQDDLRVAGDKYQDMVNAFVGKIGDLRAVHAKELADKEAERLDKIRQVDVTNQNSAAAQALTAIKTLADTTAAALLINQKAVADTATTMATQLANTVSRIDERISLLERSSYEGVGKQRVTDPQMERLATQVEALVTNMSKVRGNKEQVKESRLNVNLVIQVVLALIAGFALAKEFFK